MSALLVDSLRLAVTRETERPKVLVAASAATAATLLRRLAAGGVPWTNVTAESTLGLARRLGQIGLARRQLALADRCLRLFAVDQLLTTVLPARAYFGRVPHTPGVAAAALAAIEELRLYDVRPEAAALDSAMPLRGEALGALLAAYAALLRERGWADPADVFRVAADEVAAGRIGRLQVLLPEDLVGRGLEAAWLAALPRDSVVVLATDALAGARPAGGLPDPRLTVSGQAAPGPLQGLLAPTGPVEAVELGCGASPLAEVRAVLRRVLALGVPFDDVEIILAAEAPYLRLFRDEAERLGVPCTFGPGWPVAWTAAGRAVDAYLCWVRDDFPVRTLADALAAGDLRLPGSARAERVSGTEASRILRRAGIGWGRDRYGPLLQAYAASLGLPDPEAADASPAASAARRAPVLDLAASVQDLLGGTPVPDAEGRLPVGELCRAAARLSRALGPEDIAARRLAERLDAVAPWAAPLATVADAVEQARAVLADLRLGASVAGPGHLHVSLASDGGTTGRAHTFLLGCDDGALGGAAADPLLGDVERQRLGLPTAAEQADRRLAEFTRMLAGLRGRVFVSYAAGDPGGGRRRFPAPLVLQAFRLQQGRRELDYDALAEALGDPDEVGVPRGLAPLDRTEAWGEQIAARGLGADARLAICAALPALARGQRLRAARRSTAVTPFDGQVTPDPSLDPRLNPALVVSAQGLELLAKCPLAYFFRYVLRVRPLDEAARASGVWLDARERGSLLHAIYSRFLRSAAGLDLASVEARERLRAVGEAALRQWRERIPPPAEAAFAREAAEVLGSLDVFLEMERANTGARPVLFELAFGMAAGEAPAGSAPLPTARIPVVGGEIALRGRIDRVDEVGPGLFRIWDYKTGGLGGYPEGGTVVRGRLVQHALYAAAGQQLLAAAGRPGARVVGSGYRFPTGAGEGHVWLPAEDPGRALGEVVGALLDLVAAGTFVAAEDADKQHCRYCDFKDACDREAAAKATVAKLAAGDARLEPLRRAKDLD